jgi:sulfide:quinone oxidoreductase
MQIHQVGEQVFVSGQITPDMLDDLAAQGIRSLICNRPDNEEAGQPSFEAVATAAKAAGLTVRHVPIPHGQVGQDVAMAFVEALRDMPGPVLAYCRSGARSAGMYNAVAHLLAA